MNKKKMIVTIVFIIGIILIAVGIKLTYQDSHRGESSPTTNDIYPSTGAYEYNGVKLYIYQDDKENIYFALNNRVFGKAHLEQNVFKGYLNQNGQMFEYTFNLTDGKIKVDSTNTEITSGLYTKTNDITGKDYFEITFGSTAFFNSQYNGIYQIEDKKIYLYQNDKDTAKVIISSSKSSIVTTLRINNNNLITQVGEEDISLMVNEDNTILLETFSNGKKIEGTLDGNYKKISDLDYKDIIKNEIVYYF